MKIQIRNSNRGPDDSIHDVYLKVLDRDDDVWYVIPTVKGYHEDNSRISRNDIIVYRHPDAEEENGFIKGEEIPNGFTFISDGHCAEIESFQNNREAKNLLSKEW